MPRYPITWRRKCRPSELAALVGGSVSRRRDCTGNWRTSARTSLGIGCQAPPCSSPSTAAIASRPRPSSVALSSSRRISNEAPRCSITISPLTSQPPDLKTSLFATSCSTERRHARNGDLPRLSVVSVRATYRAARHAGRYFGYTPLCLAQHDVNAAIRQKVSTWSWHSIRLLTGEPVNRYYLSRWLLLGNEVPRYCRVGHCSSGHRICSSSTPSPVLG